MAIKTQAQIQAEIDANLVTNGVGAIQAPILNTINSDINDSLFDRVDTTDSAVALNTAKVGITAQQASDITTNNAKVGITPQQASDITDNNAKAGNIPSDDVTLEDVDAVVGNSAVADLTSDMVSDISTWNHAVTMPTPSQGSYINDAVGSVMHSALTVLDIQNISTGVAFPSGDFYMTSTRNDHTQIYLADGDVDIIHGSLEGSLDVGGNTEYIYKFTSVGMAELAFIYAQVPSGSFDLRLWSGFPVASSEAQQKIKDTYKTKIEASANEVSTGWIGTPPILSINVDTSKFDYTSGLLRHVDVSTNPVTITEVVIPSASAISPSFIGSNSSTKISFGIGGINQTNTQLSDTDRRDYAEVGLISHIDHATIDDILNEPTTTVSVMQQLADLYRAVGFFSKSGNQISGIGATLTIQKSAGVGISLNVNSATSNKDPHAIIMPQLNPVSLFHVLRDGSLTSQGISATIDPTVYDNAGVETTVPANNNATIAYVYAFPNNALLYLIGQEVFSTFADAKDKAGTETVVLPPDVVTGGLLLARVILKKNATDITDTNEAFILPSSQIAGGGASQTSLQGAYDISVQPEIITDATRGSLDLRVGSGSDTDKLQTWQNSAGGETASITGEGDLVVSTLNTKNPTNFVSTDDTDVSSNSWVLDEDNMASDSDTKVPTQQSVKKYVDDSVIGLFSDKGNYNATTDTPKLQVTPVAILKGDVYTVNVAGSFFADTVEIGDVLRALQDSPTLLEHWAITQANLDAPSIKSLYESNADTNAFTDSDQANVVKVELGMAVSDETTDLETGTAKTTFRMPYGMTLTEVRASVTTAPTGSALTVDINEGGASILSTKITIDATEKTSTTATIPPVISDSALADDAEITIDIDTIGSTISGTGLKIWLIGTRT